jgi:hypothetical protein
VLLFNWDTEQSPFTTTFLPITEDATKAVVATLVELSPGPGVVAVGVTKAGEFNGAALVFTCDTIKLKSPITGIALTA